MNLEQWMQTESKDLQERFHSWVTFMEREVEFWLKDSEIHTKQHCSRVLYYALKIAEARGLSEEAKECLAKASVFHDSRRQDDWLDVGHGQRAADYYKEYCEEQGVSFDQKVYGIMAYHDRNDELGIAYFEENGLEDGKELYAIFKDSDALDRMRIAWNGLDVRYLRTEQAKGMVAFAKEIIEEALQFKKAEHEDAFMIAFELQNALFSQEDETLKDMIAQKLQQFNGRMIFTIDHGIGKPGTYEWELFKEAKEIQAHTNAAYYVKQDPKGSKMIADLKQINEERPIREIHLIGLMGQNSVETYEKELMLEFPKAKIVKIQMV